MRRVLILTPLFLACAKSETAQDDAAGGLGTPAVLTEADIAGTWQGVAMPEGSDSIIARWTQRCAAGVCRGTMEGSTDTIPSTYTLTADSAMGTSEAYNDPTAPGAKVVDLWVLRLKDGKVVGTGALRLAAQPDSVVLRYRFEGGRLP